MNIDTHPIALEDKRAVECLRSKYGHTASSHSFASLYLWQEEMALTLHLEEDLLAVRAGSRGENTWFFPCGSPEAILSFVQTGMASAAFSLCYLRGQDAQWLEEHFPGRWDLRREETADEYICSVPQYLAMEGRAFAEQRRLLRQLERNHSLQAEAVSPANTDDVRRLLEGWYKGEHHVGAGLLTDSGVGLIALEHMEELEISGILLRLDGAPSTVFMAFPLTGDTMDVAVGKCAPGLPRGVVYYTMRELLARFPSSVVYCNQEEDLGIPGIRQMKNSLRPIGKNEMWEASLLAT